MSAVLPDGKYQFEAHRTLRMLTDFQGLIAASLRADAPEMDRTWEVVNQDDGTVKLTCVGSGRHLALTDRDGLYYVLGDQPETWRIGSLPDGNLELIRTENNRRLWLSGVHFLDHTPVVQQGLDAESNIVPTRWVATAAE